ncbi:hypothetical protein RJT34_31158 [Clitoria ternatea]|uniref:Formin-like protein n=1 Tax=Clitoria ternatea TaxID=43366 RepID=A0AAN9EVY5_CLITE
MELIRRSYAAFYVILLCALAQGGSESEGKRGKEEEFYKDAGVFLSLPSFYVHHQIQVENVQKHNRRQLIERRNNDVKDPHLYPNKKKLDCIEKSTTPHAPVSEEKGRYRYLLAKHYRSTLSAESGHGRHLIADSPHNDISPRPAAPVGSPSHAPASSPPSPSPTPPTTLHEFDEPSPPPPPPRRPRSSPTKNSQPTTSPNPPAPSNDNNNDNKKQQTIIIGAIVSGIIILIGLALCYSECIESKVDKEDSPLLILTSSDYSGGSMKVVRLGDVSNEEPDMNNHIHNNKDNDKDNDNENDNDNDNNNDNDNDNDNEENTANVRNWSIKGGGEGGNNNKVASLIESFEAKSSEGAGQVVPPAPAAPAAPPAAVEVAATAAGEAAAAARPPPAAPNEKPTPPPPGLPPPPGWAPPPPPFAPRAPPPPKGVQPPPAPSKPLAGKNQGPVCAKEVSSSSEGGGDAPKAKLKPFFWDKVTAKPDQSMVWHEINAGSFVINEEMMESLFGCTNPNKNERKKDSPAADTVQYIRIIDPRKAQNLSILLRALNVTTEEVVDALNEGNEIPVELTQTLLKMAPTAEEELKLRMYSGPLSDLGPAERFLKVLVDIPFAFKRLECLMFKYILQEEFSSIKESFATLEVACDKLRKSRLFLKLLEAVLKTGNRMNDGTYRGGAQAFKLDTLLKLSDVKGTDAKTTLLHFVVQEIIRSEGIRAMRTERASRSNSSMASEDLEYGTEEAEEHYRSLGLQVISGLSTELSDVRKAALIDGDALTNAVSKLGDTLIKTEEFLNSELKNFGEESAFQIRMQKFVEQAREEVTLLVEEEKKKMALVKSTADYFHGKSGKDEGLRLFLIVRDFLIILDKVCKEVKDTTSKSVKTSPSRKKEASSASSVPNSPDKLQQSPSSPASDLHRKLFPAIAERRVNYSDDEDDDDDNF